MTIALFFIAAVSFVLAIVFATAVRTRVGFILVGVLVFLSIAGALGGTFSATYTKPFKGIATVVSKDHRDGYRSGGVKHRRYVPECYSVLIDYNEGLRPVCLPYSQWKDIKLDSTIEIGYDKKRHKYWGSYVVGANEPLRSSNGKFKQFCEVENRKMVCEMLPENEYNKRFSEEAIKDIQQEDFREKMLEMKERRKSYE